MLLALIAGLVAAATLLSSYKLTRRALAFERSLAAVATSAATQRPPVDSELRELMAQTRAAMTPSERVQAHNEWVSAASQLRDATELGARGLGRVSLMTGVALALVAAALQLGGGPAGQALWGSVLSGFVGFVGCAGLSRKTRSSNRKIADRLARLRVSLL